MERRRNRTHRRTNRRRSGTSAQVNLDGGLTTTGQATPVPAAPGVRPASPGVTLELRMDPDTARQIVGRFLFALTAVCCFVAWRIL